MLKSGKYQLFGDGDIVKDNEIYEEFGLSNTIHVYGNVKDEFFLQDLITMDLSDQQKRNLAGIKNPTFMAVKHQNDTVLLRNLKSWGLLKYNTGYHSMSHAYVEELINLQKQNQLKGWIKLYLGDGGVCYFNPELNKSQWNEPRYYIDVEDIVNTKNISLPKLQDFIIEEEIRMHHWRSIKIKMQMFYDRLYNRPFLDGDFQITEQRYSSETYKHYYDNWMNTNKYLKNRLIEHGWNYIRGYNHNIYNSFQHIKPALRYEEGFDDFKFTNDIWKPLNFCDIIHAMNLLTKQMEKYKIPKPKYKSMQKQTMNNVLANARLEREHRSKSKKANLKSMKDLEFSDIILKF